VRKYRPSCVELVKNSDALAAIKSDTQLYIKPRLVRKLLDYGILRPATPRYQTGICAVTELLSR